jgi:biotin carboxyl carrier protein
VTRYYVQAADEVLAIDVEEDGEQLLVKLGDRRLRVDLRKVSDPSLFSLIVDNQSFELLVEPAEPGSDEYDVLVEGEHYRLLVQDEWARRLATIQRRSRVPEGELAIKAPMPGVVLALEISVGDHVKHGQGLLVLGAMKMENQIKSPRDGVVRSVFVEKGDTVEQGRPLVVLE